MDRNTDWVNLADLDDYMKDSPSLTPNETWYARASAHFYDDLVNFAVLRPPV
jgi:hypothetical protein